MHGYSFVYNVLMRRVAGLINAREKFTCGGSCLGLSQLWLLSSSPRPAGKSSGADALAISLSVRILRQHQFRAATATAAVDDPAATARGRVAASLRHDETCGRGGGGHVLLQVSRLSREPRQQ